MSNRNPCRKCEQRHMGCQVSCHAYGVFHAERVKMLEQKKKDFVIVAYTEENAHKRLETRRRKQ